SKLSIKSSAYMTSPEGTKPGFGTVLRRYRSGTPILETPGFKYEKIAPAEARIQVDLSPDGSIPNPLVRDILRNSFRRKPNLVIIVDIKNTKGGSTFFAEGAFENTEGVMVIPNNALEALELARQKAS